MTTGLLILGFGILLATIAVLVVLWRRTRRWEWLLLAFSLFVLPYALNAATRNTASEAKRAAEARIAGEDAAGFSYPVSLIASGELGLGEYLQRLSLLKIILGKAPVLIALALLLRHVPRSGREPRDDVAHLASRP